MAKSLRSKWKRKMRAVKRERYGEKELKRLNDMLAAAGDIQFVPEIKKEKEEREGDDEKMAIDSLTHEEETITNPRSRFDKTQLSKKFPKKAKKDKKYKNVQEIKLGEDGEEIPAPEKMNIDDGRVFNKRTMRDQYGNYPDWMNKRKIRTQQKKNKRLKRKRAMSVKRK